MCGLARILGKSPTLFMRVPGAVAFGFVISPRLGHEYVKGASGAFLSRSAPRVSMRLTFEHHGYEQADQREKKR
jgi:hypothetical protein